MDQAAQNKLYRVISIISNITFFAGLASALYLLAKIYLFSGALATGTCPITASGPWIYIALSLLGISLVLSFLKPKDRRQKP